MERIPIVLVHQNNLQSQPYANSFAFHPKYKLVGEAKNITQLQSLLKMPCQVIIWDTNCFNINSNTLNSAFNLIQLSTPILFVNFTNNNTQSNKNLIIEQLLDDTNALTSSKNEKQGDVKLKTEPIHLSEKEKQMVNLLIDEQDISEIAQKLNITKRSAENMRIRIKQKTNSKTLFGLMRYAIENNIAHLATA